MTNERRRLLEAQIQALPTRQVQISGELVTVKWDEQNATIYLMNNDGSWTGRSSRAELPPISEPAEQFVRDEIADEKTVSETCSENSGENILEEAVLPEDVTQQILGLEEETDSRKSRGLSKKNIIIGIAGIVVLAALAACIMFASRLGATNTNYPTPMETAPSTTATDLPTEPANDTTAPDMPTNETLPVIDDMTIYALKCDYALYPGMILDESMISLVALTDTEYQMLSSLHGIYTNADINAILGLKVQQFIPTGKYLAYADLSKDFTPDNPWISVSTSKVMLPINVCVQDLEKLLWGNQIQLEIEVKSQHTAPTGTDNSEGETSPTSPNGIDHNSSVVQSTVIDHYVIDQAVIVDLCMNDGKSLYDQYWALALVPEIYQTAALEKLYPSDEKANQLLPLYIIVEVTQEQQNIIEGILASKYESIDVAIPAYTACCENERQIVTYEKLQVAIVAVMNYISALNVEENAK